mmetsp:Transcript_15598/g.52579  ORF Transcript_15598/g.52579 Transcript_15598/m.52579 type:complete len:202 (-) Transcript_15598:13-618(-)
MARLSYAPPTASAAAAAAAMTRRSALLQGNDMLSAVTAKTAADPQTVFSLYQRRLRPGNVREAHLPITAPAGSAKNNGASRSGGCWIANHADTSKRYTVTPTSPICAKRKGGSGVTPQTIAIDDAARMATKMRASIVSESRRSMPRPQPAWQSLRAAKLESGSTFSSKTIHTKMHTITKCCASMALSRGGSRRSRWHGWGR